MTTKRIYNFSAGPAVLPEDVLVTVRDNLLNYQGCGLGIMEMSHRGPQFEEIIATCEKNLRELLDIDDSYAVLFTTGGATQQFSMVPMNLLSAGKVADYLITGSWAKNAFKEAKKFGEVRVASSSESSNFTFIPKNDLDLSAAPAYVHFTSNNTIFGTQYHTEPSVGERVLVCDASSDLLHKKIDVSKYGIVYAGAQKNLGPAGVTVVIIRKDLLERSPASLPVLMNYRTYAESGSMYNTPPAFPIYVVGEVFKWIKSQGGLSVIEGRNKEKAEMLYSEIDSSNFYDCPVAREDRSLMNVVFRLAKPELDSLFVKEADKAGLSGLKGHRSVGGMRASIYNAFPFEGVAALVEFMKNFEKTNA